MFVSGDMKTSGRATVLDGAPTAVLWIGSPMWRAGVKILM